MKKETEEKAREAYEHARDAIKGRFPKGEEAISKDAGYSYLYAEYIIKGRFPEGEEAISKSARYSYNYARDVIEGRFPEGEETISKDAELSYYYATDVIKGRFPEGEEAISKNEDFKKLYNEEFNTNADMEEGGGIEKKIKGFDLIRVHSMYRYDIVEHWVSGERVFTPFVDDVETNVRKRSLKSAIAYCLCHGGDEEVYPAIERLLIL